MLHYFHLDVFVWYRNHLIVGLFQTHQRRYYHFSRGGIVEDDLGQINDFNVGHQKCLTFDPTPGAEGVCKDRIVLAWCSNFCSI